MCIPDIMNPYYFCDDSRRRRDLGTFRLQRPAEYTMHNPQKELEVLDSLKGHFVDGVIFGSFDYTPTLIEAIKGTGLPTVITSCYQSPDGFSGYDCVYVDQPRAAWVCHEALS